MKRRIRLKILVSILLVIFFPLNGFCADTEYYIDNTLYAGSGTSTGTATGGGADYICLAADASSNNDDYNNYGVTITLGTGFTAGAEQSLRIIDYVATGGTCEKYAQVNTNWGTNPDATSVYEITVGSNENNGLAAGIYGGTNGAWRQIQKALDNMSQPGANEEHARGNIKSGRTYIIQATLDNDITDGTAERRMILQGYDSSIGDGGKITIDGNDGGTNATNIFALTKSNWFYIDLISQDATGDIVEVGSGGGNGFWFNAEMINGVNGIDNGGGSQSIFGCELSGGSGDGMEQNSNIYSSYIHDYGVDGAQDTRKMFSSIIDTTGGHNNTGMSDEAFFFHNTFYNAVDAGSDNMNIGSSDDRLLFINNIFHTATGSNIEMHADADIDAYLNNNIEVSASGGKFFYSAGETTDDPGFAGAAGGNFAIDDSLDDLGYPSTYGDSTTGRWEPGAVMYEETAGGGASTKSYGSTN